MLTRIPHFELQDRLRQLARWGIEVPTLISSAIIPKPYFDAAIPGQYDPKTGLVLVESGRVIDDHGNIVDLRELERKAFESIFTKPEIKSTIPDYRTIPGLRRDNRRTIPDYMELLGY